MVLTVSSQSELLVESGPDCGQVYDLSTLVSLPQRLVIGRGDTCNIRISRVFAIVGREHACIVVSPQSVFLIGLHENGTFVDGVLVVKGGEVELRWGARIQLGKDGPILAFREHKQANEMPSMPVRAADTHYQPPVRVAGGVRAERHWITEPDRWLERRSWRLRNETTRGQWLLILDIDQDTIQASTIEELLVKLERITSDTNLELKKIEIGSLIIKLDSTLEGFLIVENLFKTGQLKKALGVPIKSVQWEGDCNETSSEGAVPSCVVTILPSLTRIYYSYASEDTRLRTQLEIHLALMKRECLIDDWHSQKIQPGQDRKAEIDQKLLNAHLILLLISPAFMACENCYENEMRQALFQAKNENSTMVPILLRPTDWRTAPFAGFQILPTNGNPITKWRNRDEAWLHIIEKLRQVIIRRHNSIMS